MERLFKRLIMFIRRTQGARAWKRLRIITASILVFTTVYSLILPVIALEKNNVSQMAGIDLDGDRKTESSVLDCAFEVHKHTDDCYQKQPVFDADGNQTGTEKVLICGKADYAIHEHDDQCYQDGVLICTLPETKEHEHDKNCYNNDDELICGHDEIIAHEHTTKCRDKQGNLICGKPEVLKHQHTDACFTQVVQDIIPEENAEIIADENGLFRGDGG